MSVGLGLQSASSCGQDPLLQLLVAAYAGSMLVVQSACSHAFQPSWWLLGAPPRHLQLVLLLMALL
jgi:hypothetical protein